MQKVVFKVYNITCYEELAACRVNTHATRTLRLAVLTHDRAGCETRQACTHSCVHMCVQAGACILPKYSCAHSCAQMCACLDSNVQYLIHTEYLSAAKHAMRGAGEFSQNNAAWILP